MKQEEFYKITENSCPFVLMLGNAEKIFISCQQQRLNLQITVAINFFLICKMRKEIFLYGLSLILHIHSVLYKIGNAAVMFSLKEIVV